MGASPVPRQPTMVAADGHREFACFPAAILGFVVNTDDEFLLLSHPARKRGWETVCGAIRAGESPVAALLREVSEEAGRELRIRPVGSVHTFLYPFDSAIPAMFSIAYVATYVDGAVVPGSDMAMSAVRWASLSQIESGQVSVILPSQPWLFRRALAIHTLFKGEEVELEPWQTPPPPHPSVDRILAAVLFTDIVESTSRTVSIGDVAWLDLLQSHDRMALRVVTGRRGRIVKHTGDGLVAVFASVVDAVSAAELMQQQAQAIGINVRAGVHVGEVEVLADDVMGQAVVMASRVCAAASAGELLVSQTAVDLLAGSQVRVGDPRTIPLKGLGDVVVFVANTSP